MTHLLWAILGMFHLLGLLSAARAVLTARTAQGAIGWVLALVSFPYLAVPLYWIFGQSHFYGYVNARRSRNARFRLVTPDLLRHVARFRARLGADEGKSRVLEKLAAMPFTHSNGLALLVDGPAAFEAIFRAIEQARHYVLLQFFIVHDDELGRELRRRLARKAAEGVRVLFLYDAMGCHALPRRYVRELRRAGVDMRPFRTIGRPHHRFQLNFRNHRKIVVVDGIEAFVGGLNVGDEYMGRNPRFGHWRDTQVRLVGPAVACVQLSFVEDWYWVSQAVPDLDWSADAAVEKGTQVLVLPTGPADELETCNLWFLEMVHRARRRLWIVSPYFVPAPDVIGALQRAALRGVDVRILLPMKADHLLVYLASFSYLAPLGLPGIQFYRYAPGFLHQKVVLVDDDLAAVGTANVDNRSFRLNFEITVVGLGRDWASDVEAMLEKDFSTSVPIGPEDFERRSLLFRFGVRVSRLLSPVL